MTDLDTAKANADIRITGFSGNKTEIRTALPLKGRGITKHNDGLFYVSEGALDALRHQHSVVCDF